MREKITVSFFGHRIIDDYLTVEAKLYELLRIIMQRGNREIEFLVGRNGEFDKTVAAIIRGLKKEIGEDGVSLTLVMPYETAEIKNNAEAFESYYDSIEICKAPGKQSYKYAIPFRNQKMIDRSDLVIFYVKNETGGAFEALKYAIKKQKRVINLFGTKIESDID